MDMVEYRLLIISDSHIHDRANDIPGEFMDILRSGSYEVVIHAGDLVDPRRLKPREETRKEAIHS
jgi:predicted phosphodiesterase